MGAAHGDGGIRSTWAALGWEWSWLGYSIRNAVAVTVGTRQDLLKGFLVWNRSTGRMYAYRY